MRFDRMLLLLDFASCALFSGCVTTKVCDTAARASLSVNVVGPTGPICDATVMARIDAEVVTLMPFGGTPCSYAGPFERPGTFEVTASKPGFRSATKTVTVGSDECHVLGEALTLTLTAEQADAGP